MASDGTCPPAPLYLIGRVRHGYHSDTRARLVPMAKSMTTRGRQVGLTANLPATLNDMQRTADRLILALGLLTATGNREDPIVTALNLDLLRLSRFRLRQCQLEHAMLETRLRLVSIDIDRQRN